MGQLAIRPGAGRMKAISIQTGKVVSRATETRQTERKVPQPPRPSSMCRGSESPRLSQGDEQWSVGRHAWA